MIANYHTHTPRCNHAVGQEIEYVKAAIAGGLEILGFSDHTPQFFPGEHYSRMRMRPWLLKEYIASVTQLQQEFSGQLQIHLGLEAEYYPAIFPELLEVLRDTPIEYLLLGQHWNGNEEGEPYNGHPTADEGQLKRYCHQLMDAMDTGLFTYVAHPDLLHFVGSPKAYERHMGRLCKAAKSCNIPLEMNLLGLREGRNYPNLRFWELAAQEGCSVVIGSDAHRPEHTVQPEVEQQALEMVNTLGLTLLDTVPLRSI